MNIGMDSVEEGFRFPPGESVLSLTIMSDLRWKSEGVRSKGRNTVVDTMRDWWLVTHNGRCRNMGRVFTTVWLFDLLVVRTHPDGRKGEVGSSVWRTPSPQKVDSWLSAVLHVKFRASSSRPGFFHLIHYCRMGRPKAPSTPNIPMVIATPPGDMKFSRPSR